MMLRSFIILLSSGVSLAALAGEAFQAPAAYPVERYIPLWDKNPFTLKTAPAALQKVSFARNLALAGITRIGADTTVLLVNTKTREYLRLKNEEMHASGMKVRTVNMRDARSDSSVEVIMGSETSVLKYDDGFLKQMAVQVPSPANINHGIPVPAIPGGLPIPPQVAAGSPPTQTLGGPGGMINQAGVANVPPSPITNNSSPMNNGSSNSIPTVPIRRARTAPVSRPHSPAPNP